MSLATEIEQEAQELGVEDEAAEDLAVAPVQYDITSFGADFDVEGLVRRLNRGDILIPAFQRNYVWSQRAASRFIESLLLGLPVPGIFLAREPDSNKQLVIDGQQRLKTLQFFYEGSFHPRPGDPTRRRFSLIDVQPPFEGLTYDTLEEADRLRLNDSLIHATIVRQESPLDNDTSIYHIFDRLNSSGVRLTPQEIRTAVHQGALIDLVKELNEYPNWRTLYGARSARLKDQELILRFLALYLDSDRYQRPMNEFLNKFSAKHRFAPVDFLERCRSVFVHAADLVWSSVGKRAFRPASTLNAAVYDSVMVGLARRIDSGAIPDHERVRRAYNNLLADATYQRVVSQSTSDERSVAERIRIATEHFSAV